MSTSTTTTRPTRPLQFPLSRSLLSRIASPFTPKTRNLPDYDIKPDEPYRQYSPGDVVKGSVTLSVAKPIRITHLVICLHGYVKVFKDAKAEEEIVRGNGGFLGIGRGKRGPEYFGNGFASLFENEHILCGDGRLDVGMYEFEYAIELPSKAIPSNIDFERGTITYMLTSTLTRPTTICPTTSRHHKICLVESIDIAPLNKPKPRIVSIEPISRRLRSKKRGKISMVPYIKTIVSESASPATEGIQASDDGSTGSKTEDDPPESPVRSEASSVSAVSSSTTSYRSKLTPQLANMMTRTGSRNSGHSPADKTITATIELLCGGSLPGDRLPLKISIDHTKAIKSLEGIIITLYRQARVDYHPAIPVGLPKNGIKREYEDYYPKSLTGLGGLSLSSAGSSSVFRKDLAQVFSPLIVDPRSLNADVKASIRVPENVFPTISCVPGGMMTFKYYVEVMVDLRGKAVSRLGVVTGSENNSHCRVDERTERIHCAPESSFLDTDQLRRQTGVVACLFEVIIGTRDSSRQRRKLLDPSYHQEPMYTQGDSVDVEVNRSDQISEAHNNSEYQEAYNVQQVVGFRDQEPAYKPPAQLIPPLIVEEVVDEKTRYRMAEERLLPSAPPQDSAANESQAFHPVPSAPEAFDEQDFYASYEHEGLSAPAYSNPLGPLARANQDITDPHSNFVAGSDDKQEMERHRLLLAVSSPESAQEPTLDNVSATEDSQRHQQSQPTAPIFNKDDEFVSHNT